MFARHGIPSVIVSNSGSQFTSVEFKRFSNQYEFVHVITSPKHSQSNGMAESGVKIFKNIFKKCKEDNSDPYIGLLNYRNTPKLYLPSPAQLFFSRNLSTLLPMSKSKLKPKIVNVDKKNYQHQISVKNFYDKNTKVIPDLKVNKNVMFKRTIEDNWSPGVIKDIGKNPRSYVIGDINGNKYIRNKKFVYPRFMHLETSDSSTKCDNITDRVWETQDMPVHSNIDMPVHSKVPYVTRSGRTVKPVDRLDL